MTKLDELVRAADPLAGELPPPLSPPAAPTTQGAVVILGPRGRWLPRHWVAAAVAGAAGLLLALFVAGAFKQSHPQPRPAAPGPATSTTYTDEHGTTYTERTTTGPDGVETVSGEGSAFSPAEPPHSVTQAPPTDAELRVSGMRTAPAAEVSELSAHSFTEADKTAVPRAARILYDGEIRVIGVPTASGMCVDVEFGPRGNETASLKCGTVSEINDTGLLTAFPCWKHHANWTMAGGVAPDDYTTAEAVLNDKVIDHVAIETNGYVLSAPDGYDEIRLSGPAGVLSQRELVADRCPG